MRMSLARATHSSQMNKGGGPARRAATSSSRLPQKSQLFPALLDGIAKGPPLPDPCTTSGSACHGRRVLCALPREATADESRAYRTSTRQVPSSDHRLSEGTGLKAGLRVELSFACGGARRGKD